MTFFRQTRKIGLFASALVMLAFVFVMGQAVAGESRVPVPHPAKAAKGETCVAPIPEMRRYHMNYLKHQRIETLREGVRGNPYSLKGCVECHAVPDKAAGGARTVGPFCNSCHEYAAVSIDCFSCHTTKPGEKAKKTSSKSSVNQLAAHMKTRAKEGSLLK